jgi:hypothetical protein
MGTRIAWIARRRTKVGTMMGIKLRRRMGLKKQEWVANEGCRG